MVGGAGIEPATYAMSTRCSTAELTARKRTRTVREGPRKPQPSVHPYSISWRWALPLGRVRALMGETVISARPARGKHRRARYCGEGVRRPDNVRHPDKVRQPAAC